MRILKPKPLCQWLLTGDLRRALASAERLAILCGDLLPVERRDAAVLLAHAGQPEQACP